MAKELSGPFGLLHIVLIVAISIIVALLEIIFGIILRLSVDSEALMALTSIKSCGSAVSS